MMLTFQGGKVIGPEEALAALLEAVIAVRPDVEVSFNDVNMIAKQEDPDGAVQAGS